MPLVRSRRDQRTRINNDRLLSFDGTNKYIDLGLFEPLNYSGSFSISFNANFTDEHPNGGGTVSSIFIKTEPVGSQPIRIIYANVINQLSFLIDTNNGVLQVPNIQVPSGQLTHIVCSWNQNVGEMKIYENGVLSSQLTAPAGTMINNTGSEKTTIGGNTAAGTSTQVLSGALSNMIIFSRELDVDEVTALHVLGGTIPNTLHSEVIAHWPLTQKNYAHSTELLNSIERKNGIWAYYDMDHIALGGSSKRLTRLIDQSGNGNELQATLTNLLSHATIKQFNGKNYAEFESADFVRRSQFVQGNLPQPYSIIMVFRQRRITTGFSNIFSTGNGSTDVIFNIRYGVTNSISAGTPLQVSDPPGATDDFIVCHIEFDGNNSALYYNNILDASGNAGTNELVGFLLPRSTGNHDIAWTTILDYKPDAAERTNIYNELKSLYNL